MSVVHLHDCEAVSGRQTSCHWDVTGLLITDFNSFALRKDKIVYNFGLSGCYRVKCTTVITDQV